MRYVVTGAAGFIGFHLSRRLLQDSHEVIGIDAFTPYYDPQLKIARDSQLLRFPSYRLIRTSLEDLDATADIVRDFTPDIVVHLAAQPGVRYSLINPSAYIQSNVVGSFNLLEACRRHKPRHLLVASTSSVYGASTDFPFREASDTDRPLTLYAATKKSMESMAHSYSHLWRIPTTILRLFTVYGPWGRPDMAIFRFVDNILRGEPVDLYNHGNIQRDFTYVDDVVESIVRLSKIIPDNDGQSLTAEDTLSNVAPYRVVNIGGHRPVGLMQFIEDIEHALGKRAILNYTAAQPGDMLRTEGAADLVQALTGYRAVTPTSEGVPAFVRWYRAYYDV